MSEVIDITQLLPSGSHVVSLEWVKQHRIQIPLASGVFESETAWVKVNARGQIVQASQKDNSILSFLLNGGWIESCHVDCALSFMELRHAYTNRMGYKSNSIYLARLGCAGVIGREEVEDAYEDICKAMGRSRDTRVVIYACEKSCDIGSGCHTEAGCNVYRDVLERLLMASDEAWKRVKAKREQNALA